MDEFTTNFGLALYDGDGLSRARQWVHMDESTRRRTAMEAASTRDYGMLADLLETYLRLYGSAGQHLSSHTLKAYLSALRIMLAALKGANLLHLDRNEVAIWIRDMEAAGKSASTIQQRLAAARTLYKALRWCRAVDHDPFADIKPARDQTNQTDKSKVYSKRDLERLIEHADGDDLLLILLGSHAGLRVFECLRLKWEHVDLGAGRLWIHEGKGRKSAYVTASRSLCTALEKAERPNDYVIAGYRSTDQARHRLEHLCDRAGVKYLGCHALRHASGTMLQAQLHDIHRVAAHLRHSSIETTTRYVHLADDALRDSVGNW